MLFALAHAVRLQDGTYAVRSPELPGCDARNARVEVAREQFGDILRERVLEMIDAGEAPSLFTYEELASSFATRCTLQIPAPDRMPGSFDRVMAVRAELPREATQWLEARRVTAPSGLRTSAPEQSPADEVPAARHSEETDDEGRARLDPSARLARVAARLAGRDRHAADG